MSEAIFDAVAARDFTSAPAAPDSSISTGAVMFTTVLADLPALTDAERAVRSEWITRALAHVR